MLVVGMIGIMAGLAGPSISETIQRQRAASDFVRITGAMERARNRARVSVCKTLVTVNVGAGTLLVASDPADADTSCRGLPSETFSFSTKLITLSAFNVGGTATNPLIITKAGALTGTSKAIMTVTSPAAASRTSTIEVWPAIGTIRSQL